MFNRKYKKGMADAAKAYQSFGQKQEDAIRHVLEEIRAGQKTVAQGLKDLNGEIDGLYEYLNGREKASLYGLSTPLDIKELGEEERRFLVAALYQLAADKAPNEEQQSYLRAVQRYLEIKNPQLSGDILERVENIEDLQAQKAILQTVLEYLCLQGGDSYDETELQQEFLDAFSVSKRQYQEICGHVELLYRATGAKGLAEKYGFVPEDEAGNEPLDTPIGGFAKVGLPDKPDPEETQEEKPEKAHRHMTKEEAKEFIRTYGRVGKYGVVAVHMYRYSCATFLVSFDDQDNIENFYDGYRPDNLDWKFSEFLQEELDAIKDPDTKKWIYFRSDSMSDARDRYLYHKDWTYRTHFGPLDYQPLIEARHWRDPEYPIATKK